MRINDRNQVVKWKKQEVKSSANNPVASIEKRGSTASDPNEEKGI